MNRFVTIFFIHAVLCLSTNCLSQAKTSNENLSPEFTGQKYFESSRLYYFNNRYYDPALGRFLTPDPLQQYASPYSYADGDPLGRVDPSGLIFERLAELASSAFRALTSYFRIGAVDETERALEQRVQRDVSGATQGAVGGQISVSAEAIQNVSRSVSGGPSLNPSLSTGVEEGSFQDPYYSPELMDRLLAIDKRFSERTEALIKNTIKPERGIARMREGMFVHTVGKHGRSQFFNYYSKDLIELRINDRDESEGGGYYLNDVVRRQYRLAAEKGNFLNYLPKKLRISITVNSHFSMQVMNDFGLRPTDVHVHPYHITIFVEPNPNTIPVEELQEVGHHSFHKLH